MIRDGMASVPPIATVVGGVLVISAQLPTVLASRALWDFGGRSCVRLAAYPPGTPYFLWPTNSRQATRMNGRTGGEWDGFVLLPIHFE